MVRQTIEDLHLISSAAPTRVLRKRVRKWSGAKLRLSGFGQEGIDFRQSDRLAFWSCAVSLADITWTRSASIECPAVTRNAVGELRSGGTMEPSSLSPIRGIQESGRSSLPVV